MVKFQQYENSGRYHDSTVVIFIPASERLTHEMFKPRAESSTSTVHDVDIGANSVDGEYSQCTQCSLLLSLSLEELFSWTQSPVRF